MVPTDELEDYQRGSRRRRLLVWAIGALALAGVLYVSLRPAPAQQVPDFELELLTDQGTLSSEELKGMLVVVNFWASWCEPCRREIPDLNRVWGRYREDDVIVLGVNIQDTEDNARLFAERFDISYPLVRDPSRDLASALGVYGLPQTFFVDEEWKLFGVGAGDEIGQQGQTTVLGAVSEEELVEQIEAMIEARDQRSARR